MYGFQSQNILGKKKLWVKKMGSKIFGSENYLGQKRFGSKNLWVKNVGVKPNLRLNLG